MKKSFIVLLSLFFLILPFIAIETVFLILKINIFDNPDFWYGYMAYFGTVALAAVALVQNYNANVINDRLLNMQEELQRFQIKEKAAPVDIKPVVLDSEREYFIVNDNDYSEEFDVVNQQYKYFFFTECFNVNRENAKLFNVVFEVKNISNNILKEIYIDDLKIYDIITNASDVSQEKEEIREYVYKNTSEYAQCLLRPNESIKICLKINMDEYDMTEESFNINFNFSTMSIYNVIFSENINCFRNNVVDTKDRMYMNIERCYFENMPEAV